ncbi:hypothetical protein [Clostridium sp.]|nr:hypothetical protein [uncultured Clostridium sp.]
MICGIKELFDRMYNNFTAKGVGVICGEFNVLSIDKGLDCIETK